MTAEGENPGGRVSPDVGQAKDRRRQDRRASERRTLAGLFIQRAIVKRYCITIVAVMMIASLLVGIVIHHTIRESLQKEAARVYKVSVYDALLEVSNQLLFRVFFILFLSIFVTAISGILFLHRVTGPVYRIWRVLQGLAEGKVPQKDVMLREGDFFAEVVHDLNRLIARLRQQGHG